MLSGYIIVRIEFSPTDHICDNNGQCGLMETTDKNQLEVTTFQWRLLKYCFQSILIQQTNWSSNQSKRGHWQRTKKSFVNYLVKATHIIPETLGNRNCNNKWTVCSYNMVNLFVQIYSQCPQNRSFYFMGIHPMFKLCFNYSMFNLHMIIIIFSLIFY